MKIDQFNPNISLDLALDQKIETISNSYGKVLTVAGLGHALSSAYFKGVKNFLGVHTVIKVIDVGLKIFQGIAFGIAGVLSEGESKKEYLNKAKFSIITAGKQLVRSITCVANIFKLWQGEFVPNLLKITPYIPLSSSENLREQILCNPDQNGMPEAFRKSLFSMVPGNLSSVYKVCNNSSKAYLKELREGITNSEQIILPGGLKARSPQLSDLDYMKEVVSYFKNHLTSQQFDTMCPKTFEDRRGSLYLLSSYEKISIQVIQNQNDDALRKLASKLKAQIPTMPEGDVDAIRAWFLDLANQPAIQAVTRLDLSHNQISVIPPEIRALVNLRVLNLDHNQIAVIPPEIGALVNLRWLNLRDNQIAVIPPEVFDLVNLQELWLGGNNISVIPPEIGALVNLQWLELDNNNISEVSAEIRALVNLRGLDLSGNQISEIPAEIGALVNLERLYLSDNQISEIPAEIAGLVNLKGLWLGGNNISMIPPEIGALVNLQGLDLRNNQISEIPAEIGSLVNLETLNLKNNQISPTSDIITVMQAHGLEIDIGSYL